MLYDEFPHEVEVLVKKKISDGAGGSVTSWIPTFAINGFMDTPTSKERFEALQLQNPLDRFLYYPYRTDIKTEMRIRHEVETYELSGRPEDQGGQQEIMRVALKLVAV